MKIVRVEAIPYEIPYLRPLKFASGEVITADHVLLRIHTDSGLVGQADVPPRPYTYGETQDSILSIVQNVFASALVGLDPFRRQEIHAILRRTVHNNAAKGGIDIALWDIIGQAAGTSVWRLLGAYAPSMRVSHMLGFKEPELLLEEALRFGEEHGVMTFKIKVGRRPLELDVEACRVLRKGLGDDVVLYLDANRGWSANEAIEVLRRTEGLGLAFIEEPCDAREAMGRRRLVERSPIPVYGDESVPTAGDASRELLSGGCNGICIKTARSGFTEGQEILGLCTGLGVDVYVGNQIDTQIGTLASVVFGAAHEATSRRAGELSNFLDMADDLLAEPLAIEEGQILAPDVPGVGAHIDEDKLAFYRLDKQPASQTII